MAHGSSSARLLFLWLAGPIGAVLAQPTESFTATGNLITGRSFHTATLLCDGRVLVVGGSGTLGALGSAELFDPLSGTFTPTGSMVTPRSQHSATLLRDGKVLIAGGFGPSFLESAELYDPSTGVFTPTGAMTSPTAGHTATRLNNGRVLIAGGHRVFCCSLLPGDVIQVLQQAEAQLYDATTGVFTAIPWPASPSWHNSLSATLLRDGRVFLTTGPDAYRPGYPFHWGLLYDSVSGAISSVGEVGGSTLNDLGYWHTATLLANGKVLLAGGGYPDGPYFFDRSALFDPVTGAFSPSGDMGGERILHTATLLLDGTVLMTGGEPFYGFIAAEVYDPVAGAFRFVGRLTGGRWGHAATLLRNGEVLITGGHAGYRSIPLNTAELYHPASTGRTSSTYVDTGKLLCGGSRY